MVTLQFKGKPIVWNHHLNVEYCELNPIKDKSLTDKPSIHDNLVIHGDNLKALKALLPNYAGKVKCIYIDPPYNTGNEGWAYNDNVNSPMMQDWLGKTVDRDDLTRHDKWLCMITPRLKLLRELLREDGLIFISIDDNEVEHLKMILCEIFGEDNFIAQLPVIMNLKGNNDEFGFAGTHEYALVYAKNKNAVNIHDFPIYEEEDLENWQEDELGYYKVGANLKSTGINAPRQKRPNLYYPIFVSKDNNLSLSRRGKDDVELLPITDGKEMTWRWSKEKLIREIYNIIIQREGSKVTLYKKQRPALGEIPTRKPKTIFYKPEYSSGNGTREIKEIFGEKVFQNPKPVELVKDFIQIGTEKDSIILDSFSGSGTTGQAVLELNKSDGGARKFILVECENYADRITAERVRRVMKGIPKAREEYLKDGLGGSFTYFELGKPLELERLLSGKNLPSYKELAKYVFFTATGEELDESRIDEKNNYVGETKQYEVYLFYKPDVEYLKNTALTLDKAQKFGMKSGKRRIVFAPTKYLEQDQLERFGIEFAQIPFDVYRAIRK